MRQSGRIISLEGLDKSGKRVQTRMLVNALRRKGFQVETLAFPDYSTPIGKEIGAFLNRRRRYPAEVRHMLLALNRWERKNLLEQWLSEGKIVVLDRYCQSNLAYGLARGLDRDWIINLEYGLPEPDLTILLDVSAETSLKRGGRDRDIHEGDIDYLKKVREMYRNLAAEYHWKVVDGERRIPEIHEEIWSIVKNFLLKEPKIEA